MPTEHCKEEIFIKCGGGEKTQKGKKPGLPICFVVRWGEGLPSFHEFLWIVREGKRAQSPALKPDLLAERCHARCHPLSHRDSGGLSPAPGDHNKQPLWQCPLGQCCYLQRWACQTAIVLRVQSGHVQWAARRGFTATRVPVPWHRAGGVTRNPVEMQSPVNVNSSSLKSFMKETGKGVVYM